MKRRSSFFYLPTALVITGAFIFAPVQARANKRCPAPDTTVKIYVNNTPAKVIYKTGHSRSDLERLQRTRGRHSSSGKWKILGLTQTDFKYSIKTSAKFKQTTGGRFCAYPVSYDLNIGYADFHVYIDRKYRRGSCEYRAILKHENAHVTLYKSYLKRYLPYIKEQARAAALGVLPIVVSTPDLGTKYIQEQVQRRIRPLILKLNREADHSNARIDTPKSYRDVQLLCDNW
jgi:hypothetical protein